jgi:hypothetical protein
MGITLALVVAGALVALWASARAAVTVCVVDVRAGKARITRGGMAPRIFSDIADVVARPRVERATLRIVRSGGRARLEVSGAVPEVQLQRLRNVIGSLPLAQLATGRRR